MKILFALTFMLGIFVAPAYAQKGSVSFNGNIFDAPPEPGAGYMQSSPAKAKASHHVTRHAKRHMSHKNSAS
jgi:hypothetical protein